jgi:catechol 2,3-dioxygenase-like lactoylglutathione lyase family enzyme
MAIASMSHFTVLTDDVDATRAFYCGLLGLVDGKRPPFGFPGLWLYAGDRPILHVIGGRSHAELRAGVIDHMAFDATDLRAVAARLADASIQYRLARVGGAADGAWQLFCLDPNGAKVELDFDATEPAPD